MKNWSASWSRVISNTSILVNLLTCDWIIFVGKFCELSLLVQIPFILCSLCCFTLSMCRQYTYGLRNFIFDIFYLQSALPSGMSELQRLRCRVAFHALNFRPEVQMLGKKIMQRYLLISVPGFCLMIFLHSKYGFWSMKE